MQLQYFFTNQDSLLFANSATGAYRFGHTMHLICIDANPLHSFPKFALSAPQKSINCVFLSSEFEIVGQVRTW